MILIISSQSYLGKNYILFKKNKNISSSFHKKNISKFKYFYLGKTNPNKIVNDKIKTCLLFITINNKKIKKKNLKNLQIVLKI